MYSDQDNMTFPGLLKSQAALFGEKKTALRKKGLGIWQTWSWQRYAETVRKLALGLHATGYNRGDKLAIISTNRPESLFSLIAAQAAGGIGVYLYPDSTPAEIASSLRQLDITVVVAEDQEQVDKLLDQQSEIPKLRQIVYIQKRGMRKYRNDLLASFESILDAGTTRGEQQPDLYNSLVADGNADDTAIISLTSGTTGTPKGVQLTHRNIISMTKALNDADPKSGKDEYVSLLPLAWFCEQLMSISGPLLSGYTVNFPEKSETAAADLREIGPHVMLSQPKLWEAMAASVTVRMADSTPFKKFMYNTFMPFGERYAECILSGSSPSFSVKIGRAVADLVLFSALRDRLGLSNIRTALSGGSSLSPRVFRFYHAIGVNLKQLYGQTEIGGVISMHRTGGVNSSSVGSALSGVEVRISEHGEVLSKGPGLFKGYYNDTEATGNIVTADGWLRSGDAGSIDPDGHLTISDRISDVLTLQDTTRHSAQQIENHLRFSPYISEAVVFSSSDAPLTALIGISSRVVGKWAGDNKLSYMTFADLTSRPEVNDLIAGEVAKVNTLLPAQARIARFAVIYKELDADEGELTRTGTVRRATVRNIYKDLIDALQTGKDSVPVDTTVDFSDGKSGHIKTTVTIRTT